jgi:hypothetical protein
MAVMDHAPTTAPDCLTAADTCQCRVAACAHCGGEQASDMAQRQMRNLAEIGEMGMDLARQIHRQTQEMRVLGFQGATMFEQITRAVRRAHAMEARIKAESLKTQTQRAAEQARRDAAIERASQRASLPRPRSQPVADTAEGPARESSDLGDLLNDLSDRDDLFGDLDDGADEEDFDDALAEASTGEVIGTAHRVFQAARRHLKATAADAEAGGDAPVTAAPDEEPLSRPAFASSLARPGPASFPPGLGWPPPGTAAHDPPR